LTKRPRTSAAGNLSQCSSDTSASLTQENSGSSEPNWEEWLVTSSPISCSSLDIQALQPGYDHCANIQPLLEDEDSFFPDQIPDFGAIEPGFDSPVDVEPEFDYDRGFNSDFSLSYSELPHLPHTPPPAHTDLASSQSGESRLSVRSILPSSSPPFTSDQSSPFNLGASLPSWTNAHHVSNQPSLELPRAAPIALARVPCHQCPNCSKTFTSHDRLGDHILNSHKSFVCDICETTLTTAKDLRRHQREGHKDRFPAPEYLCQCGYDTPRKSNYDRHVRSHQSRSQKKASRVRKIRSGS